MGPIPLHTQELFSKIIIGFYHTIVSEVRILHGLHPWDPYLRDPAPSLVKTAIRRLVQYRSLEKRHRQQNFVPEASISDFRADQHN